MLQHQIEILLCLLCLTVPAIGVGQTKEQLAFATQKAGIKSGAIFVTTEKTSSSDTAFDGAVEFIAATMADDRKQ